MLLQTILIVILVLFLFLAAYMLLRTMLSMRPQQPVEAAELLAVDPILAAEHLSDALKIATVSQLPPAALPERELKRLHHLFEKLYPRLHATLHREVLDSGALLYSWLGRDPDLPAIVLMGHLDVVPAEPENWTHPPFGGVIADAYIWGRGALDCKGQVVAILEAVEALLKTDFHPDRTIYLAFGTDEEVGGHQGAQQIAALLQEKGVELYAVLDEGGTLVENLLPGTEGQVALVGNAEKGHLCIQLTVDSDPGHSSMPGDDSAIKLLAEALVRLKPGIMSMRMNAFEDMYNALGNHASFGMQFVVSNAWFFKGLLRSLLSRQPKAAAIVRTTIAPTLINGGVKENILPARAQAVINLRLLPGDSLQMVTERVRRAIKDDRVKLEALPDSGWEASPVSDTDTEVFDSLSSLLRQVYPEAAVAPFLVLGATDSRYFAPICSQVFRISPILLTSDELGTVHGVDERLSIEALGKMVSFYMMLTKEWAG